MCEFQDQEFDREGFMRRTDLHWMLDEPSEATCETL
jgi:hypothetical protein